MRRVLLALVLAAGLGGLSLSLAPVARAGSGCHAPLTASEGSTVEIEDLCFVATVLHVEPGTEVEWVNRDQTTHNVIGVGADWSNTQPFGPGGSISATFSKVGIYPYYCAYHPGMVGVVVVETDATAADGTAALDSEKSADPESSISRFALVVGSGLSVAAVAAAGLAYMRRSR